MVPHQWPQGHQWAEQHAHGMMVYCMYVGGACLTRLVICTQGKFRYVMTGGAACTQSVLV